LRALALLIALRLIDTIARGLSTTARVHPLLIVTRDLAQNGRMFPEQVGLNLLRILFLNIGGFFPENILLTKDMRFALRN